MIYCLRDALLTPSLRAAELIVSPPPSRRLPRRELIARSSQMSGVREEDEVITGRFAEEGIGVKERSGWGSSSDAEICSSTGKMVGSYILG